MKRAGLPVFLRLAGRPAMLLGDGPAADAKRRLLERAGATLVGEEGAAAVAIVALEGGEADAAAARLRARGLLVNVVDRPELCDFTLPAIVDRDPVVVAIGTGGVSAGLAAALRQRLEALLPAGLGRLADGLHDARETLRGHYPDAGVRRQAIGAFLAADAPLDPLVEPPADIAVALPGGEGAERRMVRIALASDDPDDLTLRAARALGQADRIYHPPGLPPALLDRARADAERIAGPAPSTPAPGLTVELVRSAP